MEPGLSFEQLEAIRRLDACNLSNAIETFGVRLRNEGFADSTVRCMFPDLPPVVGYAATCRIRSAAPPIGGGTFLDRTDWWNYLATVPAPRIVVMEDIDERPGLGALIGEVHSHILRALGCTALVTNGAVRDLQAVAAAGFPLFAGNVAVSHAYAHILDFSGPVSVGGLPVHSGDLLHGDRHGVQQVPKRLVPRIPSEAERLWDEERRVIALCGAPEFSLSKLREAVEKHA